MDDGDDRRISKDVSSSAIPNQNVARIGSRMADNRSYDRMLLVNCMRSRNLCSLSSTRLGRLSRSHASLSGRCPKFPACLCERVRRPISSLANMGRPSTSQSCRRTSKGRSRKSRYRYLCEVGRTHGASSGHIYNQLRRNSCRTFKSKHRSSARGAIFIRATPSGEPEGPESHS
jgi:hypothetical protein